MGHAIDENGKVYIVARYQPPGNTYNGFERNVKQCLAPQCEKYHNTLNSKSYLKTVSLLLLVILLLW